MASLIVISWRDVPAQVIVKRGREVAKVQLSQRFQEAVDRAAMRAGRGSSDAYLEDWRRAAPRPVRRRPAGRGRGGRGGDRSPLQRRRPAADHPRQGHRRTTGDRGRLRCRPQDRRNHLMYAVRLWSVRHARGLSRFYAAFEALLVKARAAARADRLRSGSSDRWLRSSASSRDCCSTAGCAAAAC